MTAEYTAAASAEVDVLLKDPDGKTLISRTVSLVRATTKRSQTIALTVPAAAAQAKYDVAVAGKASGRVLDTEKEAVAVETKVVVSITAPTRSQPVTVKPGDRVSVEFEYTADASAEVDVLLKGSDGKTLVSRTVSLARTTTKRSQTTTLTVPSSAAQAKYDVGSLGATVVRR